MILPRLGKARHSTSRRTGCHTLNANRGWSDMCELLAMSCRHPTRLTSSLTALAAHAQGSSRNRDGWGLAFYQGRNVALYRGTEPADASPMVRWLESGGPRTRLSLGYIRHATQGMVELANTGPFVRELNGRIHCFSHNGNLARLLVEAEPPAGHYRPVGATDSELAFCQLLSGIERLAAPPFHDLPPWKLAWRRSPRWSACCAASGRPTFSTVMVTPCLPMPTGACSHRWDGSSRPGSTG